MATSILRKRTVTIGTALALCLSLIGCSASSQKQTGQSSSDGIPSSSIKLGLSPYGDELLIAAAIKRGYLKDVGITVSNGTYGAKTDLIKSVTPLLNKQIDLGSGYPPSVASQLDNVKDVVGFAYSDVFFGYRILAPKGKYKTLSEEMKKGKGFDEALTTVMKQLKGKEVLLRTGVAPTFYNLLGKYSNSSMDDWEVTYLSNDDILRQAEAGNAKFVSPTGAVEISRLQKEGWESLVDLQQAIQYMPKNETVALRATFSGYITTRSYAEKNWDTLLRFTSVMYRIIKDMQSNPQGTADDFVAYVNSYTGSSLTAKELASTFDGLYELQNFDDADAMFNDSSSDFNFRKVMDANLKVLQEQKVLKGSYTSDDLSDANKIYNDLKKYKTKTDALLKGKSASDKTVIKAKKYYDMYDFLDAYRIAKTLEQ